mgnify:FL=1
MALFGIMLLWPVKYRIAQSSTIPIRMFLSLFLGSAVVRQIITGVLRRGIVRHAQALFPWKIKNFASRAVLAGQPTILANRIVSSTAA